MAAGASDPLMNRRVPPKPSEAETATAIYYSVKPNEDFETAAQRLFELVGDRWVDLCTLPGETHGT